MRAAQYDRFGPPEVLHVAEVPKPVPGSREVLVEVHGAGVRGAAGGVGSLAVQLGRALGAHVTALAGARNLDRVAALGDDAVLDYRVTRPDGLAASTSSSTW